MRLRTFGGLWIENAEGGAESAPRPRGLALLAILAAAGPRGASRDRVLGILWPDSDTERARHALSQTLYSLRRDLGAEVALSTPDLKLDPGKISSDLEAFRAAVRARQWQAAGELYRGPFLDGFYLADAPDFQHWAESERAALAADGLRAVEALARAEESSGRLEEAAEHWRRLTRLDPLSGRYAAAYMTVLAGLGDRAGALAHGKQHAELLRRELDAQPDRAVAELLARLRSAASAGPAAVPAPPSSPAPEPVEGPDPAAPDASAARAAAGGAGRRRRPVLLAAGALVVVAAAVVAWRVGSAPRGVPPVLAVGTIKDLAAPDSLALGGVLSEMMATSLGRLSDLPVIANSRMLELRARGGSGNALGAVSDAARRAGATELLEGEVRPLPDHRLLLEVRRVSLAKGLVRRGYRVTGPDRLALFDSMTSAIAADLRVRPPERSLAEVSTRSLTAYRLYEEGLRAHYQFDGRMAARLFESALREDSTFAMAAFYAWRVAVLTADSAQSTLAKRALALAPRAPDRDRMLMQTHIGAVQLDPRAVAVADTLATRYPHDPEVLVYAGELIQDFPRAEQVLNRAVALDSATGIAPGAVCHFCEALKILANRYAWVDSLEAAYRTVSRWIALRPNDHVPWYIRSDQLISLGRRAEAETAFRRAEALGFSRGDPVARGLSWSIRLDDIEGVNAQCASALATSDRREFPGHRWFCTIGLRVQGRYREARALIHDGRLPGSGAVRAGMPPDAYNVAILDLETGRPLAAADTFLAIGRRLDADRDTPDGLRARNATWMLTLAATAAVAGGDTARARRLLDSIQSTGRRSAFDRDPLLHHFVRGLLLARAGRHADAVPELRAAMASPSSGYTRINSELGKSLLALGRPREAIPVLRAPLRGGIEGSNLYLTRTEAHELLARAFEAAGQGDSAAVHYAVVERAWRGADPFLKGRYEAARARLTPPGRE